MTDPSSRTPETIYEEIMSTTFPMFRIGDGDVDGHMVAVIAHHETLAKLWSELRRSITLNIQVPTWTYQALMQAELRHAEQATAKQLQLDAWRNRAERAAQARVAAGR